jgi:hypothetical protein
MWEVTCITTLGGTYARSLALANAGMTRLIQACLGHRNIEHDALPRDVAVRIFGVSKGDEARHLRTADSWRSSEERLATNCTGSVALARIERILHSVSRSPTW